MRILIEATFQGALQSGARFLKAVTILKKIPGNFLILPQQFTCSKSTTEILKMVRNMFKVNNKNTKTTHQWSRSGIFTVIFEHILLFFLVFLLLTLNRQMFAGASTAWKVSKYGVSSGPYFPAFGLNTSISPFFRQCSL